jgi:cation:H+ antiporter
MGNLREHMTLVTLAYLVLGLVLLVLSADWLVKGASRLASSFGVSALVIGLTVVAYGTSAPELAVSVMAAFSGQADLAIGNVVGSNICNVLFILGVAALITPLIVHQQLVRLDVPVMIVASLVVYAMSYDGMISRVDGILLFGSAVAYTVFLIRQSRKETRAAAALPDELEKDLSELKSAHWGFNLGWVVLGCTGLVIGSKFLVTGAVAIAHHFGVSELMIGLTVVALGTSLPEVATSVMAGIRGERDIAVGNVVGSNIFNILSVLGLSSIVAPDGLRVAASALVFDMPVMIAVALACFPIFFVGYRISRPNGAILLSFYVAYIIYLIFSSTHSQSLAAYQKALIFGVAPLTLLALAFSILRGFRQPNRSVAD